MSNKRNDPYKAFNFIVEIDNIATAGFSECSGLTSETTVIEYREGGDNSSVRKLPGLTKFSNITLKRGLTANRDLWKWRENIVNGTADRRDIAIVLLDDSRAEIARFLVFNAWPCKWVGPTLNAKGNDIAIEELELAHERLELE
jgi:phage tail-like protein